MVDVSRLNAVTSSGLSATVTSKGRAFSNGGTGSLNVVGMNQSQVFSRIAVITPASLSSNGTISDSMGTSTGGAQWRAETTGEMQLNKSNTAAVGGSTGANLAVGKTSVVGITYDGTTVAFFVDGRPVGGGTSAQTFTIDGTGRLFTRGGGAEFFNGSIGLHADFSVALPSTIMCQMTVNPWQLFLFPTRRWFAPSAGIAFDAAANSGYQAAQSTYTFNRTVTGSNTFLAIDVSLLSAGQTVTSIVDDFGGTNVAAIFVGAQTTVSSVGRVELWRVIAPVAGTKTIQVNLSGSISSAATAVSYTGVHQSSPTEGFNSAQATNVGAADATVSITSVADNCWIHGAVATDDTSITANQTTRNNVTGVGGSGANEDNNAPKTPAGAVTMSYTGVGALATWAIGGYAIRPIAASGLGGTVFTASLLNGLSAAGKFFRNPLG